MGSSDELQARLSKAIAAQDANRLELTINEAFRAGLPKTLAPLFAEVLSMDWHTRHEDVAGALQSMKDPRTVEALFAAATATHSYLGYDEFFGLARKCTWALADIGTADAKMHLRELSRNENAVIAGYAQRRLDRWEAEIHRKRSSESQ